MTAFLVTRGLTDRPTSFSHAEIVNVSCVPELQEVDTTQ